MSEHLQCSVASAGIKTNSPGSCGVEGAGQGMRQSLP